MPESRAAVVAELEVELTAEGLSEDCIDQGFELYADYYACFAASSCETIGSESTDCSSTLQERLSDFERDCGVE